MSDNEEYISVRRSEWEKLKGLVSLRFSVHLRSVTSIIKSLRMLLDGSDSAEQRHRIEAVIDSQEQLLTSLNAMEFEGIASALELNWDDDKPPEDEKT
jgi:hypothetical protein